MKILYIIPSGHPLPVIRYGGIERIAQLCIQYNRMLGNEVYALANKNSEGDFTLLPWDGVSGGVFNKISRRNSRIVYDCIMDIKPDIVHDFCLPFASHKCPKHIPVVCSLPSHPWRRHIYQYWHRMKNTVFVGCGHHITQQIPSFFQRQTIYNSLDIDKYQVFLDASKINKYSFLGRIEHSKGVHLAIEFAEKIGAELDIAGNISHANEAKSYFEQKIKPHLSSRIRYIGEVDDKEKNILFGESRAFLNTLQWHEPFGLTTIEAMASGTPVIAFPLGSMPELIIDQKNGLLVSSIDDFINKIPLLDNINRMDCRLHVEKYFSSEIMCQKYNDLYNMLLTQPTCRLI